MKKKQWWHKYALSVGLFAFVTLLSFMILSTFVWSDFEERSVIAENQKVGLQEKIEDAKRADLLIEQLTEQITLLIGGNDEDKGKLDKAIDIPDMLNKMEEAAEVSGLKIRAYKIGGTGAYVKRPTVASIVTSDGTVNVYNVSLEITVKTTYEALQAFVEQYEDTGYYVTVNKVEVERIDNNINKEFEGTLELVVYSTTSGGVTESTIVVQGASDNLEDMTDSNEKNEEVGTVESNESVNGEEKVGTAESKFDIEVDVETKDVETSSEGASDVASDILNG